MHRTPVKFICFIVALCHSWQYFNYLSDGTHMCRWLKTCQAPWQKTGRFLLCARPSKDNNHPFTVLPRVMTPKAVLLYACQKWKPILFESNLMAEVKAFQINCAGLQGFLTTAMWHNKAEFCKIFTLLVFSTTMNIRKILTTILQWNGCHEVWAGCSEYHPVVH